MPMLDVFDPITGFPRQDAGAVVYSVMLFPQPDETDKRLDQQARERFRARQMGLIDTVSQVDLFRIAEADRNPKNNWRKECRDRQTAGWRAGDIAYNLIRAIVDDPARASVIEACRLSASKPVNDPKSKRRLNAERLAERAWRAMLPAVHLWGAAYFAEHEDWLSHHWMSDPHGALMRMLRHAQMYRKLFEGFIQRSGRNAGKPVLPPGGAWQPPIFFTDELDVLVPRLTDAERDAVKSQRLLTDQRSARRRQKPAAC